MRFLLLGPLVIEDERGLVHVAAGKESALLALLLVRRADALANDRIVDELWGEAPPENATKSVQVYVSRLRKLLGADRIETTPGGYRIRLEPSELDVERFEELAAAGRAKEALALWRGEPLGDFRYASFAQVEARRLEELHRGLVADLVDDRLAKGETPIAELEATIAREPMWERPRGQLMRALYLAGRQGDALDIYRRTKRQLADELGLDPSPELQRLERAILNHDPELGTPARPRRPIRAKRNVRLVLAGGVLLCGAAVAALFAVERGSTRLIAIQPNSVAVIDAKTSRLVAQVAVGDHPSRLAVDGSTVWVLNAGDGTLSAIDARTERAAPGFGPTLVPSDIAATPGVLWVGDAPAGAGEGATTIARFDASRHIRLGTTRLSGRPSPGGGRPAEERYLVAAGAHIWVIGPSLAPVELAARTGRVQRVVHVVANSLAVDRNAVWATAGRSVVRIDRRTGAVVRIPVSSLFELEGIAAGGGAAWATSSADGLVWRIVAGPLPHVSSIPVGFGASTIAYGDGAVWVGNRFDDSIVRIDASSLRVTRVAAVPAPQDIAVAGSRVYVAAGAPSGRTGPVAAPACGKPIGPGRLILVSDLPLQGAGSDVAAAAVHTIQEVLARHGYRAGRARLAYQSCSDATAAAGGYDDGQCIADAGTYAGDGSVIAVIGTYNSGCAADEIPVLNRAPDGPLAMISPFDTGPFLTRGAIGDARKTLAQFYAAGPRNFFRTVGADHIQAAADAVFARRRGADRIAVVFDRRGMLQQRTAEWFTEAARHLGLHPLPILFDGRPADAERALRRLRADSAFVASAVPSTPQQAQRLALALGTALPGRPLIVTDSFGPPALAKGSAARIFSSVAVPRVRVAVERLIAAIAASNGTRRSVDTSLARSFDRYGDPPTAPIAIYRWAGGGARLVTTVTPAPALVPAG